MKKVLFASTVLSITLFLAFCTKADLPQTNVPSNPDTQVSDRGTCTISVFSDNVQLVRFCGTKTNKNACTSCAAVADQGTEVLYGNGSSFTVTSPIQFSVRTDGPFGSYINLVSAAGQTGFVFIPAGTCRTYSVADDCTITPI